MKLLGMDPMILLIVAVAVMYMVTCQKESFLPVGFANYWKPGPRSRAAGYPTGAKAWHMTERQADRNPTGLPYHAYGKVFYY